VSDNFGDGTAGNMLALVDLDRQCISKVVKRTESGLLRQISHHPDTGINLIDYPLPELEQAIGLAQRCAAAFPDIPAIGWDIVITDEGPKTLEGNPMFDPVIPQLSSDQGIKELIEGQLK